MININTRSHDQHLIKPASFPGFGHVQWWCYMTSLRVTRYPGPSPLIFTSDQTLKVVEDWGWSRLAVLKLTLWAQCEYIYMHARTYHSPRWAYIYARNTNKCLLCRVAKLNKAAGWIPTYWIVISLGHTFLSVVQAFATGWQWTLNDQDQQIFSEACLPF